MYVLQHNILWWLGDPRDKNVINYDIDLTEHI